MLVLTHTALTTPRREWRPSGFGLILAGWSVALIPNLIDVVVWLFIPGFAMPGQRWYPLLLVAIPVSMALAVRREAALTAAPISAE